jgi:hypothetical protein
MNGVIMATKKKAISGKRTAGTYLRLWGGGAADFSYSVEIDRKGRVWVFGCIDFDDDDCNLGPVQEDFDAWKVLKQCLSGMEFSNVMTIDSEVLSRDEFSAVVAGVLGNDANENPFECEVTCVDFSGTAAELLGIEPEDDES